MKYLSTQQASRKLLGEAIHKTLKGADFDFSEYEGRHNQEMVYSLPLLVHHKRFLVNVYSSLTEYHTDTSKGLEFHMEPMEIVSETPDILISLQYMPVNGPFEVIRESRLERRGDIMELCINLMGMIRELATHARKEPLCEQCGAALRDGECLERCFGLDDMELRRVIETIDLGKWLKTKGSYFV